MHICIRFKKEKKTLNVHKFFRKILPKFKLHFTSSNCPGVYRTRAAVSAIPVTRSMADETGISLTGGLSYRQR